MSKVYAVQSLEVQQRKHKYILGAVAVGPLLLMLVMSGFDLSTFAIVGNVVMSCLICGVLFHTFKQHSAHVIGVTAAAEARGMRPCVGTLFDQLPYWPSDSFAMLEDTAWTFPLAFQNADGSVRYFEAVESGEDAKRRIHGAAIRIPNASLPWFSIVPYEKGFFKNPEPSPRIFHDDPSFADDYTITTKDARTLDRTLNEEFVKAWRTLDGWKIEGHGEWVIAWTSGLLTPEQVPLFTTRVRTLSDALREDAAQVRR